MKSAIMNNSGTVGKTTITTHLFAPRVEGAKIFAVETINETAAAFGLEVEKVTGDQFGKLYRQLPHLDNVIIDVGASNIEDFLDKVISHEESHHEIDYFIIPTTPSTKVQRETLQTIALIAALGVSPDKIRVLFNRVDCDVSEEFAMVLNYARKEKNCTANPAAFIKETELFDMLLAKKLTINGILADETDYRSLAKEIRATDAKKSAHYSDLMVIKSLAKSVNRNLDAAFGALFA